MEDDNSYSPGLFDKFASSMISVFLNPIKKLTSKRKKSSNHATNQVVEAQSTTKAVVENSNSKLSSQSSLAQKAEKIGKTSRFRLPEGIPTKKIVVGIGVLVFILVLLNLVLGLLNRDPDVTPPTEVPTTSQSGPSEPSIYADDQDVLVLEEKINVLDRELSNVILRDTTLKSPTLDFNIAF